MRVEFDGHRLDTDTRELVGPEGATVPLEPQAFDVLAVLVRERHRVVPRAELLDEVWGSQFVTDSALATRIKQVRQAVGDDGRRQEIVKTLHGRGVRFVAEVTELADDQPGPARPAPPPGRPEIDPDLTVGPLIGRTDDLELIATKTARHRVVTLTGPGGVGKTHLLHHVARRVGAASGSGAVIVELAPLRTGEAVGSALLAAVGAGGDGRSDPLDAAIGHLRSSDALLLLDNAEHVIDEVAAVCRRVQDECPEVRLVVSSRRPLALPGEALHAVAPLAEEASAELFVQQAQLVGADMEPSDPAVRELCRRVDGIPLAVRVLAGRSHVFSVDDLSEDLAAHLGRPVGDDGRHESVEGALAWSIEALDADDRGVLQHLSVAAGWFDLAAAAAIAGVDDVTAPLLRLHQQSLVVASPDRGVSRFRLLEPIRLFVATSRADRAAEQRHADHYLAVAERAAIDIDRPEIDRGFATIERDWANLRLAFEHHRAGDDLAAMVRMVDALADYAEGNLSSEVHRFAAIAFEAHVGANAAVPLSLRANHARFVSHRGDLAQVTDLLRGIRESDGSNRLSTALMTRDFFAGDLDATRATLEAGLDRNAGTGGFGEFSFSALAIISGVLPSERVAQLATRLERLGASGGYVARCFGDYGLAVRQLHDGEVEQAIDTLTDVEERFEERRHSGFARVATSLRSLALVRVGDPDLMRSMMVRSLERGLDQGAGSMMAGDIARAARLLARFGDVDTAVTLASAGESSGFAAGAEAMAEVSAGRDADGGDDERWARAVEIGRSLTLEDAARLAIEALSAIA
ncbi:MAG: winged helix-turn-helix domain-containing protein [Actinomycetota bacterium]